MSEWCQIPELNKDKYLRHFCRLVLMLLLTILKHQMKGPPNRKELKIIQEADRLIDILRPL